VVGPDGPGQYAKINREPHCQRGRNRDQDKTIIDQMKKFGVEPLGNEFAAMILARSHNADIAVG
jgi:hypothetical protein